MYNQNLSILEILILAAFLCVSFIPFKLINLKNKLSFVNPLIIYNIFFLYYCFFSPIIKVFQSDFLFRGLLIRDTLIYGWIGSLITVTFLLIGYFIPQKRQNFSIKKRCSLDYNQMWRYGFLLSIIGLILYSITSGFDISIFNFFSSNVSSVDYLIYRGSFVNYFRQALNF